MTTETQQLQAVYNSSDVAVTLKIQESTLRKYCLLLEKHGYEILKNESGHRAFFDSDIIVLKKLIEFKSNSDMTLEQATKAVVSWKKGNVITDRDTTNLSYVARYNDLLDEFKSFKEQQFQHNEELQDFAKQQVEFNKKLVERLDQQEQYIANRLEERDRNLMLSIRETLETKRLLEVTEEKKKSWWKFWK